MVLQAVNPPSTSSEEITEIYKKNRAVRQLSGSKCNFKPAYHKVLQGVVMKIINLVDGADYMELARL